METEQSGEDRNSKEKRGRQMRCRGIKGGMDDEEEEEVEVEAEAEEVEEAEVEAEEEEEEGGRARARSCLATGEASIQAGTNSRK
jgi:hypothetical protein